MTTPSIALIRTAHVALLTLAGRSVLDHALDRLAEASVGTVLIEPGDQPALLRAHLAARAKAPNTILLDDQTADQHPCRDMGFLVDGDVAWFDGPASALSRLADGFDADRWDGMLMLARATELGTDSIDGTIRHDGLALDPLGVLRRPEEIEIAPFVFAGVQLVSARLFNEMASAGAAPSQDRLTAAMWDRAMAEGRLGGLVHDGVWFNLQTARDVEAAERSFEDRMAGVRV